MLTNDLQEPSPPRVSVVMPVKGPSISAEEAIRSILGQSLEDLELIIVAEPGEDGLDALVRRLDDGRVRLVRNDRRLGLARSLNTGIALSRGAYIARMDSDDVSLPERLEKQVAFLDANSEVGVLGTHLEFPDGTPDHYGNSLLATGPHLTRWYLHFHNAVAHPSVMMRRKVWERSGGYLTEAEPCEDYELWLRAMRFTDIMSLPEPLVSYRTGGASVSSSRRVEQNLKAEELALRALQISLGRPLDHAMARAALRPYSITTPRQGVKAAHILYMLYSNFQWWERVRGPELSGIQKDVGARLSHIFARSVRVSPMYSSMVLWQAARFGPRTFGRFMLNIERRGVEAVRGTSSRSGAVPAVGRSDPAREERQRPF